MYNINKKKLIKLLGSMPDNSKFYIDTSNDVDCSWINEEGKVFELEQFPDPFIIKQKINISFSKIIKVKI